MEIIFNRTKNRDRIFLTMVCLLSCVIVLSGCQTLRKKFTRTKKADKEDSMVMPVLEPIDYEPRKQSFKEVYQYRYSLWKNWYRDLLESMDSYNEKRMKYLMIETVKQLQEMENCLTGDKKQQLVEGVLRWQKISQELDVPSSMRDDRRIKRLLSVEERFIRQNFNPKASLMYRE